MVECLPSKQEALGLICSTPQTRDGGAHLEHSTGEVGAKRSEVQCYPRISSEFKASLGYMRLCLKKRKRFKKIKIKLKKKKR